MNKETTFLYSYKIKQMEKAMTIEEELNDHGYIKMDYTIETPEGRKAKVEEIIANTPPERLTPSYLEKLADYLVIAMDKEERKKKKILTENRLITVNKRETSFEGLVGKLENGEDGIYSMITNDKNILFQPKVTITAEDIDSIPPLKQLQEAIAAAEEESKTARGRRAFQLKKSIIAMRQDQYVILNAYKPPVRCMNLIRSAHKIDLSETISFDPETGELISNGLINFFNPKHVSAVLCNYSSLKEEAWDKISSDLKWMMEDFDGLVDRSLKEKYPMYYDLVVYKIDGKQNAEIQELLYEDYNIKHSVEYISSLWRNKIPRLIAEMAVNEYLTWYYTFVEHGKWKRCSRCGQIKLAHNNFFSKNNTSKDGFYSICKDCRNKKK